MYALSEQQNKKDIYLIIIEQINQNTKNLNILSKK